MKGNLRSHLSGRHTVNVINKLVIYLSVADPHYFDAAPDLDLDPALGERFL